MDGNEAAAYASYAFTEVAAIYPITPSSPMAELVDKWSANGMKNMFGQQVKLVEMQSECGAVSAVHGALDGGVLATSYTASQGLMLMIPTMYRIAGQLKPGVIHVASRNVATHAISINAEHSDVMACRQTGYAMLASSSPQEAMDLGAVAHLAAIKGHVPFLHFFDGFRTSHEIQKVECLDYEDLKKLVDWKELEKFRENALNPEHPVLRTTGQYSDTYFQSREACNTYYDALPDIVADYMNEISKITGRDYKPFNYYGAPDAERVIVVMGSASGVLRETVDYLNAKGEKVGFIDAHLYRPFSAKYFLSQLPETVKMITVGDRTKEPGSIGEPLYQDVVSALYEAGKTGIKVVGGRYGLGSKDTPPASAFAVFEELKKDEPKREFTIGIVDDVTNLSLPEAEDAPNTAAPGTIECKFWGLGGDGTVGANKNSIKIIGDHTDKYVQAYFQYDSKKTGGVTVSHLRFGDSPIRSPYYVTKADFVACHNPSYIVKGFKMVRDVKPGGTFLVNCQWSDEEFAEHMPAVAKRYIANNNVNVYLIDAIDLAAKVGMGKRTNTVLQSAFFALAKVLPAEDALQYMKDAATKSYMKKGQAIVDANHKAIDAGATAFRKFEVPADWATAEDAAPVELSEETKSAIAQQVKNLLEPIDRMDGDSLPVSAFVDCADGQFELGASAYEKRGVAVVVPHWDETKCIQCNQCAYVCPHATIRPFAMTEDEAAAAPEATRTLDAMGPKAKGMKFTMAVSPLDCMGCTNCVKVCPKGALEMVPTEQEMDQQPVWDYMVENVSEKKELIAANVKGSQFKQPYLEFSGSCAGCAETAYARLVTQVAGDRMFISNATGCSSIWGNPAATAPYCKDKDGHGPAWNNSLFEDNAEHGLGMAVGYEAVQHKLIAATQDIIAADGPSDELKAAGQAWIDSVNDAEASKTAAAAYVAELEKCGCDASKAILADKAYLTKKSFWIFGGDGWAYDIGFGGLDHVLASGHNVNVFVFDTEVYSNTGGQASKASNLGQVAQFAAAGKVTKKKSLAEIAMSYGYVYVPWAPTRLRPSRPSTRPRPTTARPSSSATAPARCTPSRRAACRTARPR